MKSLDVEALPPSPFRLPAYSSEDRVMSVRAGIVSRLLRVGESPVLVRAWEPSRQRVLLRAEPVDPAGPHNVTCVAKRGLMRRVTHLLRPAN